MHAEDLEASYERDFQLATRGGLFLETPYVTITAELSKEQIRTFPNKLDIV